MQNTRRLILLLGLSLSLAASAAPIDDAFKGGADLGRSRNPGARATLQGNAATSIVPGYAGTPSAAGYFGGPGLGEAAAASLMRCAASPADPACQATNFTQDNPMARKQFTLDARDPLLTQGKAIAADPSAIAGNIAGTYSACTAQTVTTPDVFSHRVCHEYRTVEHNQCVKNLIVSVTDNGLNCSLGEFLTPNPRIILIRPIVFVGAICAEDIRFQWTWGYAECNGYSGAVINTTAMPGPETQRQAVNLGCGGAYYIQGGCEQGECNYAVGIPDISTCTIPCDDGCCKWEQADFPITSFQFRQPVHTYSISDAWDNQCTAFEARLP